MNIFIDPNSTKFNVDTFKAALRKRYSEAFDPADVQGAFNDAIEKKQTLGDAVKELVDLYVQTDGHERFLILTPAEIAHRKDMDNRLGILRSIEVLLKKPHGCTAEEIVNAVRMQLTLRKFINYCAGDYCYDFMHLLISSQVVVEIAAVYQYGKMVTPITYIAAKAPRARLTALDKLTQEQRYALCPDINNYAPREQSSRAYQRPRQQYESTQEHQY